MRGSLWANNTAFDILTNHPHVGQRLSLRVHFDTNIENIFVKINRFKVEIQLNHVIS